MEAVFNRWPHVIVQVLFWFSSLPLVNFVFCYTWTYLGNITNTSHVFLVV
jgi:hypothetical protein